jgi:hypothetical protein
MAQSNVTYKRNSDLSSLASDKRMNKGGIINARARARA